MKKVCVFIILLCFSVSGTLSNPKKTIEAKSNIDRVMVYHDRALVTRKLEPVELKEGTCELVLKDLPERIKDESVRAKFTNISGAKILDVEVRTYQLEKAPEKKVRKLQEKLQQLEDREKIIIDNLELLKIEKKYLISAQKNFLNSDILSSEGRAAYLNTEKLRVKDYDRMLHYLKDRLHKNFISTRDENKELRDLRKKTVLLKGRLSRLNVSLSRIPRKKLVKVTAEIQRKGYYSLEISYINYNVNWKPGYDIRVLFSDRKTEFTGYGIVSQASGEDWMNTKMSYSTARPAVRGWLPELLPLYVTTASKIQRYGGRPGRRAYSQRMMNKSILSGRPGRRAGDRSGEDLLDTSEVKTDRQVGSLVFHVPKRADIPSDNSPHRTAISRQTFPVRFEYISIPKLSPHAYLQAIGTNNLKMPILRGDLNIFMNNDFVGSSYTDNILPGEDFELTLSVNENIRVTRTLDEKEEKEGSFLSGMKKLTYTFLIKIENYTSEKIIMNIIDQIPVRETDRIEIENVTFSHKPEKKTKKGIVKWQFSMEPQKTIDVSFSFTVSVPKDMEAAFFRTKLAPSMYLENQSNQKRDKYMRDSINESRKKPAMRQKKY